MLIKSLNRCEFRKEAGVGLSAFPQGFNPLPTHKIAPLYYLKYQFLMTNPRNVMKTPSAQTFINLEGRARTKKTQFFGQHFPKSALKRVLHAAQKIWSKLRLFSEKS